MSERKGKIIHLFKTASARRKKPPEEYTSTLTQTIRGDKNIQVGGDMIVTTRPPAVKILPPLNSIGADPLLKQAIQERFNRLGEEREKRFGKSAYSVLYKKFKTDFGIKNNPWTVIWTWPQECAKAIIIYLDEKFSNTIHGKTERAARRPGYIHTRGHLYGREKELLEHLNLTMSSPDVKRLLSDYFGVTSHTKLSHLQHWQWVCYLEDQVGRLEKE